MTWLASETRRPVRRQATPRARVPSSARRLGATGWGETRGGSMTRNCAPPASCTSMPIVPCFPPGQQALVGLFLDVVVAVELREFRLDLRHELRLCS